MVVLLEKRLEIHRKHFKTFLIIKIKHQAQIGETTLSPRKDKFLNLK